MINFSGYVYEIEETYLVTRAGDLVPTSVVSKQQILPGAIQKIKSKRDKGTTLCRNR